MPNVCKEADGTVSFKECCRASGKMYLLAVCAVFFLIGTAQIVLAVSTQITTNSGIGDTPINLTASIGGCVLVACLVGFVGILKMNRCWLSLFAGLMVLLLTMMVFASLITTSFMKDALNSTHNIIVNNYLNCTFQGCCTPCVAHFKDSSSTTIQIPDEYCRKYSIPCDEESDPINSNFCSGLENELMEKCATNPTLFRSTMLIVLNNHFRSMVVVLIGSCGVILIALLLSIYFTVFQKKSKDVLKAVKEKVPEQDANDESSTNYVHKLEVDLSA